MEIAIDLELDVLITGETGTGKELVAKGIHYNSPRSTKIPVTCDCSTLSKELAVSDLFGHPKGAFTGADADKIGLFEAADGSTLVLDEIGNLPLEVQRHLLRVLEERKVRRLSETLEHDVDVRVIAMTNLDLDAGDNLVRIERPDSVIETREYDDLNRLIFLENAHSTNGIISSYTYNYDSAGNIITVEEHNGRRVDYVYDALDRLIRETITDPLNGDRMIDYTYDTVGNRLIRSDSVNGLTTYTYDENDRLLSESAAGVTITYTYDANGNTLSRIQDTKNWIAYEWDFENRLVGADVTIAGDTTHIEYQYDADGIRVSQVVDGEETYIS